MQTESVIVTLGENLALLVLASFCYGLLHKALMRRPPWVSHTISGILFGFVGWVSMLFPLNLADGVILDGRYIMIVLAGPFGGGYASFIAAAIVSVQRILIGGAGLPLGLAAICVTAMLGFLWHRFTRKKPWDISLRQFLLMGLTVWMGTVPLVFILPYDLAISLIQNYAPPYLLFAVGGCGLMGVFLRNESSRLHSDQLLAYNTKRFADFTDVGSDYFWEMDDQLRFNYISENYELITGIKIDELIGLTRRELWKRGGYSQDADQQPGTLDIFEAEDNRKPFRRIRISGISPEGHSMHLELSGKPVFDEDGRFQGYRGVGLDVSSEVEARRKEKEALELAREARSRAENSDMAKSDFLARMSHELRSPLNAVIGFADMMASESHGELGDPRYLTYSENISKSGQHLLELIGDILDLTKIEAGQLELEEVGFSIRAMMDHLEQMFQPSANERQNELIITCPEDLQDRLIGDPTRLMQVLVNLLSNAMKFTRSGRICLSLTCLMQDEKRACIRFAVEDSGVGIHPDKLDSIFDPFSQADSSTTRNYGGSGLGLAVSRSIVNAMGGEIEVASEEGRGSVFSFLADFLVGQDVSSEGHPMKLAIPSLNCLVVDDIPLNRDLARAMLQNAGHHVDVAEGGHAALDFLNSPSGQDVDVILLDIHMPDMDGFETFSKLKETHSGNDDMPTVIALTADVLQEHVNQYHEVGMDGFVPKPFRIADLNKVLDKLIYQGRIKPHHDDQAMDQPALSG